MICEKPTKKYPDGRRGTAAGYMAHKRAKEAYCAECTRANSETSKDYNNKNPERRKEYSKKYLETHREEVLERRKEHNKKYRKENRGKLSDYYRKYYEKNKEEVSRRNKEYRKENKEKFSDYYKEYRKENKEKILRLNAARRALKRSLPYERYSPEDITIEHGTTCRLCGSEVDVAIGGRKSNSPHVDHVHPLSREGCPGDVLSNVRWTHAICNIKKGALLDEEITFEFLPPNGSEWELLSAEEIDDMESLI